MKTAEEIIEILLSEDESERIEAKECTRKIDCSVMETICAFANEPDLGGGYIILGLKSDFSDCTNSKYAIVGIENPDKIQNEIVSNCTTMFNHRIVPYINVERIEGKNIMVVKIPEGEVGRKPFFFKNSRFPEGAYRRIGASDHQCTADDTYLFLTRADDYEKAIVEDADLSDVDDNAVRMYRNLRAKVNPYAEELAYDDKDLLLSLGCLKKNKDGEWRLTNAGLLVFGSTMALRRILPAVRADYIRISGTEWVENPDSRFETIDMRSPMILLVGKIYNAIINDIPRQFALKDGDIQASTRTSIPEKALREAIVNALIHRSYSTNRPIQIIRYSNRVEIINPGYSLKPEESLGEPGSALRNPAISAIFHETNLAETKGSGIKSMRILMGKAGLLPPTYESNHGKNVFTLRILLHNLFGNEDDMKWLSCFDGYDISASQRTALVFLREVGALDISTYRQISDLSIQDAKKEINKMLVCGLIEAKGRTSRTYYIPSPMAEEMFGREAKSESNIPTSESKIPTSGPNIPTSGSNIPTSEPNIPTSDVSLVLANLPVPEELKIKIQSIKKKENQDFLLDLIEEISSFVPLSVEEMSVLLNRNKEYVKRIIRILKKEGKVSFTHPEMIHHPEQKYKIGLNSRFYHE